MLRVLLLILPVLVPSWRFFDMIAPSPRVQWCMGHGRDWGPWQVFRPKPQNVSPLQMLARLFWNPSRNDDLFVISCAERIAERPTEHSIHELNSRILAEVAIPDGAELHMRFRLVLVTADSRDVVFVSDAIAAERL